MSIEDDFVKLARRIQTLTDERDSLASQVDVLNMVVPGLHTRVNSLVSQLVEAKQNQQMRILLDKESYDLIADLRKRIKLILIEKDHQLANCRHANDVQARAILALQANRDRLLGEKEARDIGRVTRYQKMFLEMTQKYLSAGCKPLCLEGELAGE